MTRAFVAVRPPGSVLDEVARLSLDLGEARLTTREQWHVTLQFLGNRADIDAVTEALSGLSVPAAIAQLGGLGAFPNERRARVVWLGLAHGGALFSALAHEVGERLTPLGHPPEGRAYHAHLTLARLKKPAAVTLPSVTTVGDSWTVESVVVYESVLRRSGAQYVPRSVIPLVAARDA